MSDLPRVCVVNGEDRNDDLDSVDPNIKCMLQGKVKTISLQAALDAAIIAPVDAVLTLCHAKVDGQLLDKLGGKVRTVSNYGVGVDHIDLEACATRSITVGNTPGVLTEATADMGWALLMACARRIPEGNDFAKSDAYTKYDNMLLLGRAVSGSTVGIVGMGRLVFSMVVRFPSSPLFGRSRSFSSFVGLELKDLGSSIGRGCGCCSRALTRTSSLPWASPPRSD